MNYIISASTDIGISKSTNQDSLSVKSIQTSQGQMVFAILCDGMGGLQKGEVASASVVKAFHNWVTNEFPYLCNEPLEDHVIRQAWENIVLSQNEKIANYGKYNGVQLGTTATVMLLTDSRYYILNIGDTRAYEITDQVKQITEDQTFIAREVKLGNMTEAEAEVDPRKSVLLQCIGASPQVYPDLFFGATIANSSYMLCSDGFRHEITEAEILSMFHPQLLTDRAAMEANTTYLIELNKQRQERDNISVILIRTY